ncbi:hypothetical protein K435DRAFT_974630, partial [Dendrothele bispora CBS 962.96]
METFGKKNSNIIDLTLDDDDDNDNDVEEASTRVTTRSHCWHPAGVEMTDVTNLSSTKSSATRRRKTVVAKGSDGFDQSNVIVIESDSDDEIPKTTSSSSVAKSKPKRHIALALSSSYNAVASSSSRRVEDDSIEVIEVNSTSVNVNVIHDERQSVAVTAGPSSHSWREGQDDSEPLFHPEDAELAKRLAEEERKDYRELIEKIEGREEGIVFRVVVNADGTLEDGTPAHPDDIARFEPWRQNFEAGGQKVKRFHWIVNYELEKRFEAARDDLRNLLGEEPEEIRLWHGTASANIDSILKGGFRIGGMNGHPVQHGAALGRGIYLAKNGSMSVGYAMGADRIFGCRGEVVDSFYIFN